VEWGVRVLLAAARVRAGLVTPEAEEQIRDRPGGRAGLLVRHAMDSDYGDARQRGAGFERGHTSPPRDLDRRQDARRIGISTLPPRRSAVDGGVIRPPPSTRRAGARGCIAWRERPDGDVARLHITRHVPHEQTLILPAVRRCAGGPRRAPRGRHPRTLPARRAATRRILTVRTRCGTPPSAGGLTDPPCRHETGTDTRSPPVHGAPRELLSARERLSRHWHQRGLLASVAQRVGPEVEFPRYLQQDLVAGRRFAAHTTRAWRYTTAATRAALTLNTSAQNTALTSRIPPIWGHVIRRQLMAYPTGSRAEYAIVSVLAPHAPMPEGARAPKGGSMLGTYSPLARFPSHSSTGGRYAARVPRDAR